MRRRESGQGRGGFGSGVFWGRDDPCLIPRTRDPLRTGLFTDIHLAVWAFIGLSCRVFFAVNLRFPISACMHFNTCPPTPIMNPRESSTQTSEVPDFHLRIGTRLLIWLEGTHVPMSPLHPAPRRLEARPSPLASAPVPVSARLRVCLRGCLGVRVSICRAERHVALRRYHRCHLSTQVVFMPCGAYLHAENSRDQEFRVR